MLKNYPKAIGALLLLFTFLFSSSVIFQPVSVMANGDPQVVPFSQNWSNVSLITATDDWSTVPGIIGYRGDGLTGATGTNPQTILQDGSTTPVNVFANQGNPNTFTNGGVGEFDQIADSTIALNGSGTADAPHIVINLNTSGTTAVNFSYKLRDLDGSADNSVQPFALQYRVGNTGNYTNITAGFVADATTGPNQATQVTPVSVILPAACENQPLVQLRIMTTNAASNDEWVGIDDLSVTGTGGGNVQLSGVGVANPTRVNAGAATLLTVTVTPASDPVSTGIGVTGNLSTIGLAASQQFFDNATNGDVTAGDNVFSFLASVPVGQQGGPRVLPVAVTDFQGRNASASINVTVANDPDPRLHLTMGNPSNAVADPNNPANYLLAKPQFVMSYHRDRGIPNWVAWHLDVSWLGSTPRQDSFRSDPSLPAGWYRVQDSSYSGSGFDRGHHTPSGDRTATEEDNDATFYMTNMMPQAPDNNQGPWAQFEEYCRTLAEAGNELYIYAGGMGQGGTGGNGSASTIDSGRVTVPSHTWKVVIVIPNGINDAARVTKTTRVIGLLMPNQQGIRSTPWRNFRVPVRRIEALTGLRFFTNVSPNARQALKTRIDIQ